MITPPPTGGTPALGHDPVLLVHGWNGAPSNWIPFRDRMVASGWQTRGITVLSYSPDESNATVATTIRLIVDGMLATHGATRVDIITHSMGGLSSRHYIRFLGGSAKVDAWVSIAGPNNGTQVATLCAAMPCIEMRSGSTFLTTLNAGIALPPPVRYATWWSACDEGMVPRESPILTGAQNTQTGCVGHVELLGDAVVAEQVMAWIEPAP